jgi:Arc/MetJ family transcription regulator
MKTTVDIPDELFRRSKAMAALRGESLKDFVTLALRAHLEGQGTRAAEPGGWRAVFGQARPVEVEEVDAVVAEEFERVDAEEWR